MKYLSILVLLAGSMLNAWSQEGEQERGMALFKQGKYQEALVVFDEIIATHPDWYFPTFMKARCEMALKKFREALASYQELLSLETPAKEQIVAKFDMAKCHLELKEYPATIKLLNEILDLAPATKKFDVLFMRGQAEFQHGRAAADKNEKEPAFNYFSKAIASFSEALKHPVPNPKLKVEATFQKAYAQYEIGNVQGSEKSLTECLALFESVLREDPRHRQTHDFLVDVSYQLVRLGKGDQEKAAGFTKALNYAEKALEAFPNDPKMTFRKGQALQGLKRYAEASEILKKYVGLKPADADGWFHLASTQMAAKNFVPALESFNKALQTGKKGDPNVYTFMAYCYQEQKSNCYKTDIPLLQKAVDTLNQGMKATNNHAQVRKDLESKQNNLAILLENQKTDEDNRKNFLANVKRLEENLGTNEKKLESNVEMQLQTPTPELEKTIKELKQLLISGNADLQKQLQELKASYEEAKRCGGEAATPLFAEISAVLKKHKQI